MAGLRTYAQVLLDIQVQGLKDRLFTYGIPDHLEDGVFVGAQVLVPFGPRQMVAGYVVSFQDIEEEALTFKVKDIFEVVDPLPLFDQAYIEFLAYIADRYCASLQDVVAAAVPSCLVSKVKRSVCLKGGQQLCLTTPSESLILQLLRASSRGMLSLSTLRQKFEGAGRSLKPKLTVADFHKALKELCARSVTEIKEEEEGGSSVKTVAVLTPGQAPGRTARQKEVKAILEELSSCTLPSFVEKSGATRSTIEKMVQEGQLVLTRQEVVRESLGQLPAALVDKHRQPPVLTAEQEQVFAVLSRALEGTLARPAPFAEGVEPWLLHGVTGSGKTEVYLRLITACLAEHRTALFLVPEIALTPQLSGRLRARFGDLVSVWHSAVSAGERYDTWRRLRAGSVKVLLGARSAVLANMPDLGLIVLDEEHDASYKQSSPAPRYNARDLALEKARRSGAMVLLGSATPDLGSFERARAGDRLLTMVNRVFQPVMPEVKIVDMRNKDLGPVEKGIFSNALKAALKDRLEKAEQVVLLINRRGFASHIFCQACGNVCRCKNCSVSLVMHSFQGRQKKAPAPPLWGAAEEPGDLSLLAEAEDIEAGPSLLKGGGYLACHHCGFRQPLKPDCPSCGSPFLKVAGVGTQKVELEVLALHPSARVVRLDSDIARKKGAYEAVLAKFSAGEADVLIGTQMVAKGLDIPGVTLVGVLLADAAFNLPDYRSVERGFQLLTQVAGRAGRGDRPGSVILQTYTPELPVLKLAAHHDYHGFFQPELESRRLFDYPPFARLTRLLVSGEDLMLVESVIEILAEELSRLLEDEDEEGQVKMLGPAPCLIERIKGRYRYHLIIKNRSERLQRLLLDYLRHRRFGPEVNLAVDVDALDLV